MKKVKFLIFFIDENEFCYLCHIKYKVRDMKNRVLMILSCILALLLSLCSCKSGTKSENNKFSEVKEISYEDKVDEAINALEDACKTGDRDGALTAYEDMLRILLDKTKENSYEGIYAESSIISPEQEERLDALSDCECLSDEDVKEITDRVEAEY